MRFALLFGPSCVGDRPLDFSRIEDDDTRVMTGTDSSFLGYGWALAQRGHEVTLFVDKQDGLARWNACLVRPYEEAGGAFDAAIAWNDGEKLAAFDGARLLHSHGRGFAGGCPDGVDAFLAPSSPLMRLLGPQGPHDADWYVLPNGPGLLGYPSAPKVPGRCLWASSPDRGLHVVLGQWPRIRAAVPTATLRVFYGHSLDAWLGHIDEYEAEGSPTGAEHALRARLVRDLLDQPGVERCGVASARRMAREYAEAECLAYSADTIGWSESFGVSVLEGLTSGATPVLGGVDAFPELWGEACPMVFAPSGRCAPEWADLVVEVLTKPEERAFWQNRGWAAARRYDWQTLGALADAIVRRAIRRRKR
jgi:hypothetical protein